MSSNTHAVVDRETASQHIEGVDFGTDLWVIARSPQAVLIWVKGHSWSGNGFQRYAAGVLIGIPSRGPETVNRMNYLRIWEGDGKRFGWPEIFNCREAIDKLFGQVDIWRAVRDVVRTRKTLLIEGGAGQLRPPGIHGASFIEWRDRGGGFLVLPEGMTEHDACRHKLGWKPREAAK